jgi:hypothetical protein
MAAENIRDLQNRARHARRALGWRLGPVGGQQRETIERAHDRADHVGGDLRIERRVLEFGVAEQHLDHPDVGILLEQMGGKAVP